MLINPYTRAGGGGPATDPFFSSVVLLLHLDNTGSATVIDSSPQTQACSNAGGMSQQATIAQFGSAAFCPSGSSVTVTDDPSLDFATGDFTIEGWFLRPTGAGVDIDMVVKAASLYPYLIALLSGKLWVSLKNSSNTVIATLTDASLWPLDTWQHFALVRHNDDFLVFRNGTLVASTTVPGAVLQTNATNVRVGFGGAIGAADSYFDDVRFTTVARYTANFAVPTSAFPDS